MAMTGGSGGRRRPMAEINITPFTDVCLVLLIIFMISASFMNTQRGLDVKLPSPSSDTEKDTRPTRDIMLTLNKQGVITMDVTTGTGPTISKVVAYEQLLDVLSTEATKYQVKTVTIKAERGVVYNNVVRLMDAVKTAGIDYMALAVQAPPGSPAAGSAPAGAAAPGSTAAGSASPGAAPAGGASPAAASPSTVTTTPANGGA